jgi:predicted RNA-binding Zn-ribbon protein involved in translation (DUF1610 family)
MTTIWVSLPCTKCGARRQVRMADVTLAQEFEKIVAWIALCPVCGERIVARRAEVVPTNPTQEAT